MERVVPAEAVSFGELSRVASHWFVDADDPQLAVEGVQLTDCRALDLLVDPTGTTSRRQAGLARDRCRI